MLKAQQQSSPILTKITGKQNPVGRFITAEAREVSARGRPRVQSDPADEDIDLRGE